MTSESQAQKRAEELVEERFSIRCDTEEAQHAETFKEGYLAAWHDQQKVIEKLVEVLGFYAQGGNFQTDVWEHESLGYFTGKRARETLKHLKDGGK